MSQKHFYLTTTLPYVNAEPHIGFALEIIEADVIARYQRLLGKQVFFNTGTDEHGQKIYQKALNNNQKPQAYCNQYAAKFTQLKNLLNLSYTNFIRTTDKNHAQAAQQFWLKSLKKGDIYKAKYKIKYCVGCELEKTDSELENGCCPLHPNKKLEEREEENYFFKFSKYQQPLLELYQQNPEFVQPEGKMKEIQAFVKQGLKDFSISRLKEKMPWGIPVPNDSQHVMYVWFDALINYVSTLGWPESNTTFKKYWPGIQLAGKDNLRQQAAMWQAMLMSAGLPNSRKVLINGFISINGQKMSKSLGNIISPKQMVEKFGSQATRFLLISLGTFNYDLDVSWQKFITKYQADLAKGLGNLCSRVAKMAAKTKLKPTKATTKNQILEPEYCQLMDHYQLTSALDWIIGQVSLTDKFLSKTKPWKLTGADKKQALRQAITQIIKIGHHLQPFMPLTAAKIQTSFSRKIKPLKPLFPRLKIE